MDDQEVIDHLFNSIVEEIKKHELEGMVEVSAQRRPDWGVNGGEIWLQIDRPKIPSPFKIPLKENKNES